MEISRNLRRVKSLYVLVCLRRYKENSNAGEFGRQAREGLLLNFRQESPSGFPG